MAAFLETNPKVIQHASNASGRDFVVGDLHGCRSMLDQLLRHVEFDGSRDRLFSVGDLVDRGPDSVGCLELLREPWFYPVLGNHDALLIAWLRGHSNDPLQRLYRSAFLNNGGGNWIRKGYQQALEYLLTLENLPLTRKVDDFWVVHAEITPGFNPIEDDWENLHLIEGFDGVGNWVDHVLWGRELLFALKKGFPKDFAETRRVYCGHSIRRPQNGKVARFGEQIFLDAGAYTGKPGSGLILWEPAKEQGFLLDAKSETVSQVS